MNKFLICVVFLCVVSVVYIYFNPKVIDKISTKTVVKVDTLVMNVPGQVKYLPGKIVYGDPPPAETLLVEKGFKTPIARVDSTFTYNQDSVQVSHHLNLSYYLDYNIFRVADSFKVSVQTKTITKYIYPETVVSRWYQRFGYGPNLGVGLSSRGPDVYIGFGIFYKIN